MVVEPRANPPDGPPPGEAASEPRPAVGGSLPSLSLPKGGGAIRGIGEKFAANPVTGTGSLTIPVPTSPGRSGFGPTMALTYDSGNGNGPFGYGWSLALPAVTRGTDKALPRYRDGEESDVFILSGAEDLVPVVLGSGGTRHEDTTSAPGFVIHRYRPRVEGLFARIERWTRSIDGDVHWRSITRDNVLTLYGKDAESRIAHPTDGRQVFSWLICETRDAHGNAAVYDYSREDGAGVDLSRAHERNRGDRVDPRRAVNRYLKGVRYGNRTPLLDGAGQRPAFLAANDVATAGWMFEVVLDYEQGYYEDVDPAPGVPVAQQPRHVRAAPSPARPWAVRPDPFSTYRAGFEVRTHRRCRRILMFHHLPALPTGEAGYEGLVRATELDYEDVALPATVDAELAHPGSTRFASFVRSVTQSGFARDASAPPLVRDGVTYTTYVRESLPPLQLEYSQARIREEVRELDAASLENLPAGLDGAAYRWLDLDGEGVSGVLAEQGGGWFYKRNLGDGVLGPLERLKTVPAAVGGKQFLDLAGDGLLDLVTFNGPAPGFYERTLDGGWESFRAFRTVPNLDWSDPNVRFVDLAGGGQSDVLVAGDAGFRWYESLGEEGFAAPVTVRHPPNEEHGPRLVFADGTQSVHLADMSGDGLADLVRVRNGEVAYWPNLGHGRFGAKIAMDDSPWFAEPDQFVAERVRFADIDGSGTADLAYLGRERVALYFNQAGNGFSEARPLLAMPHLDDTSSVLTVDLLANGTACLVWSSPLPEHAQRPLRFIDLMGSTKPHLLTRWVNNLGTETEVDYTSSTRFYLDDAQAGRPWITRLPFPVHVVERVTVTDHISGNRFVTRHAYHHGFFDGVERELRGFAMVEQWDAETFATSDAAPMLTRTWFHTGVVDPAGAVSRRFAAEYYGAPAPDDPAFDAFLTTLLPDTVLPAGLTAAEEREACRALRGSMLRQEVYALDGGAKQAHPYVVTEQNSTVLALQRRHANRHGVFFTHARESLAYHYEREPDDPRVAHTLTLETDVFGNVLASATIGYGRRVADATLDAADQLKQSQLLITYSENAVTIDHDTGSAAIDTPSAYRAPAPYESRTYELTGLALPPGHVRFTFAAVRDARATALALDYADAPTAGRLEKRLIEHARSYFRRDDLSAVLPLGHVQALAVTFETHKLAFTPALVARAYGGRVTDAMLGDEGRYGHTEGDANWWIPSGRTFYSPDPLHTAAQELAYARQHFRLAQRRRDPFHSVTASTESLVTYDGYDLLVHETADPLGNRMTAGERRRVLADGTVLPATRRNDYRVLQPAMVMDPNRNCTEVRFGALGLVTGTAVMGKPEALPRPGDTLAAFRPDLTRSEVAQVLAAPKGPLAATVLDGATTRVVYDLSSSPAVAATFARETHASDAAGTPRIQVTLAYSDGFGREIQTKAQAEPGPAPLRGADGRIVLGADGRPELTAAAVSPRWVGSGWTVFNAKGKPVSQFEPFFTDRHGFEPDAAIGVSPVLFYDPPGRVVATLHPDHSWEKVVRGAWSDVTWDANDTVALDPATDPDVRDGFGRLPVAEYRPTWMALRTDPANAAALALRFPDPADRAGEVQAAGRALVHAATPVVTHTDALGRTVLTVNHNAHRYSDAPPAAPRVEAFHRQRVELDVEGNRRRVRDAVTTTVDAAGTTTVDPLGRIIAVFDYDMLGTRVRDASMEAGVHWTLNDVAGKPLYTWDSLGRRFRTAYDVLRRPTDSFLLAGAGAETTIGRSVYGESLADPEGANARGLVVEVRDQAGVVVTGAYDFKGNPLRSERRLVAAYDTTIDWAGAVALEPEVYSSHTRYDALNRPIQIVPPHDGGPGTAVSVIQPAYNEANLLERIDAWLDEPAEPAGLLAGPALAAVTNIDYDAKGRRTRIDRGGPGGTVVRTSYVYDRETSRLTRLYTRRGVDGATGLGVAFTGDCENPHPPPATIAAPDPPANVAGCGLQSLRYTYDAKGNLTWLRDGAQQPLFFNNRRVEPSSEYTYDALYRLIEATGREHLGQVGGPPVPHGYDDAPRAGRLHPGDGNAMANYVERYVYDAAGNFVTMRHRGADPAHPGWTRAYTYAEPSQLEPAKTCNRLTSTSIGGATEVYSVAGNGYDPHGSMLRMPQLSVLEWSFKDQLRLTQRQTVNAMDADGALHHGERTWYVYDSGGERVRKVTELANGQIKDERRYLGGVEVYRRHGAAPLTRETLHITDDQQAIALVETRTAGAEPGVPARLVRHQFGNHIGSVALELDDQAQVISYEEYTPYGSTAYQAVRNALEAPKRYRSTGRERDAESGLYHHGARYYAPWLGRWTSADPAGVEPDPNRYRYCRGAPVMLNDPSGMDPPTDGTQPDRFTPLLTTPSLTGIGGNVQLHNVWSADRSVSGNLAVSGDLRSSFMLTEASLGLNTTGVASVSALAAVDTDVGRAGLRLRGGLLLGELSGLNLVLAGSGQVRIPVPDQIPVSSLPGSLLESIPAGEGTAQATFAARAGGFTFASGDVSATLADGHYTGRVNATSWGGFAHARLDLAGGVSPQGDISVSSADLNATISAPGLSATIQGTARATGDGSLALSATADTRVLFLPSLHVEGTGTASLADRSVDFGGRFYGPGPLFTSYITGNFNLSTRTGISASASVFGLTYTPGISIPPSPPLGPFQAAAPWTPDGLTVGASFFQHRQGLTSYVSGGFMPDLSQRILTNPRFGISAQWHF